MTHRRQESGMALISVLMIISTMSLFALIIIDSVKFATRTSINFANNHQMKMFADSAETVMNHNLKKYIIGSEDLDKRFNQIANSNLFFEIPDGVIQIHIADGNNCFNINSIVSFNQENNMIIGNEDHAQLFENLLIALGVETNHAKAITAETIDWIDTDDQTEFMGAEDDYYVTLDNPYRTGRTLILDVSELHALRSMTPEIYKLVRPFLCAENNFRMRTLNVNTVQIEKAPLIAAYLGDDPSINDVLSLFTFVPNSNYRSVDDYFRAHNIEPNDLDSKVKRRFTTTTRLFHVTSVIKYRESFAETWVEFAIDDDNNVSKIDWRYGTIE